MLRVAYTYKLPISATTSEMISTEEMLSSTTPPIETTSKETEVSKSTPVFTTSSAPEGTTTGKSMIQSAVRIQVGMSKGNI